MDGQKLPSSLSVNASDNAVMLLKGLTSLVDVTAPGLGSLFGELIGHVIPGQRNERLVEYVAQLARKLRLLHETTIEAGDRAAALDERLKLLETSLSSALSAEQIALFEDGARIAVRATKKGRIEQIANLVANGFIGEDEEVISLRQLTQLIEQLSDEDIVRLCSYRSEYAYDVEWTELHAPIIGFQHMSFAIGTSPFDREYRLHQISKVQRARLIGLGLLHQKQEPRMNNRHEFTSDPQLDLELITHSPTLTGAANIVLLQLGLLPKTLDRGKNANVYRSGDQRERLIAVKPGSPLPRG